MNEKVDLTKILKNCPKGFKLYSPMVGEVEFERILDGRAYPIITSYNERTLAFTNEGFYYDDAEAEAECLLFPSAEQRDWRKFKAPWYKKEMDINSMSNKDDERLRKTAIAFLKDFAEQGYENAVECIDWLEKQGEQEEPKFKVGDWLCANELNNYANLIKIVKIVDVFGKKRYKISRDYDSDLDLTEFDFIEKHYHLWTIQDAKDGDVLADEDNNIGIFQECEGMYWYSYTYLGCDGQLRGFSMGGSHEQTDTHPATKEQRDLLFQKIKEAGYKWNYETKTLEKLIKPKFDPKTLQPFDRVLVKDGYSQCWRCNLFSHTETEYPMFPYTTHVGHFYYCIPYNNETKHLLGTNEEAPTYYRYWED